jgi:protein kinase A
MMWAPTSVPHSTFDPRADPTIFWQKLIKAAIASVWGVVDELLCWVSLAVVLLPPFFLFVRVSDADWCDGRIRISDGLWNFLQWTSSLSHRHLACRADELYTCIMKLGWDVAHDPEKSSSTDRPSDHGWFLDLESGVGEPSSTDAASMTMLDLLPASDAGQSSDLETDCQTPDTSSCSAHAEGPWELSDLELGATVGVGTFARVRVAKAKGRPKTAPMALKILHKQKVLMMNEVDHVKNEIKVLNAVDHPFIVKLQASWQDHRSIYMLMDFVNGGELFSVIQRKRRIPEDQARLWIAELVLAFEHLHSMDIAYRDLKPENVLMDTEGHLRLADFGFAKVVETRLWTMCGTPEYLAPEVIKRKGHGCGVDWWALGILIYEVLAGNAPFTAGTAMGIYEKIVRGEYKTPPHFSPTAKDLIKKLLRDKSQRLGCMKEGTAGIKAHQWFSTIDFIEVLHRRASGSYIPKVSSAEDTSQFDRYPESTGDDLQALSAEQQALFNSDFGERRSSTIRV